MRQLAGIKPAGISGQERFLEISAPTPAY